MKFGTWATTVTPLMIDHAWTARGGLANIGIACGPAGLVVLDEDKAGTWTAGPQPTESHCPPPTP